MDEATNPPHHLFDEDDDNSSCSTPYVSAPSSPGRPPISGFFYSAPASPMHFSSISAVPSSSYSSFENNNNNNNTASSDFEFSARFNSTGSGSSGSMSSADELFLNGQIRPMKLSTHLQRPQVLAPLLDLDEEEEEEEEGGEGSHVRGRDLRLRDKSLRRRTRSLSPLRNTPLEWIDQNEEEVVDITTAKESKNDTVSAGSSEIGGANKMDPSSSSASRSSSAGRSSKRWVFLKDFLRSKSEGRSNNKFWSTISFSPTAKEKKPPLNQASKGKRGKPSPHELHYKAHRAQAEELRKKTFLPYRQGLLGCLGFSSKGYGAMNNGFARALNPVSSR